MEYTLKDKIEVTKDFLAELNEKSWQEVEAIQQQIANIDVSTPYGVEVTKLLKNICTGYYILIGYLESTDEDTYLVTSEMPDAVSYEEAAAEQEELIINEPVVTTQATEQKDDFEPFEYFVDFDEPFGEPLSDKDLYG
jgi:hypothetical protein